LASANLRQRIEHRLRRIAGSGKHLQHLELAAGKGDTIRKCAASVDRYAQLGPLPYGDITTNPAASQELYTKRT
jgi:ubiquinone/menaquinone biosynthesis C-methylase UbiE